MGIEDSDGVLMDIPIDIEPSSSCNERIILDPGETCSYVISHTPERAPYNIDDTMRIRYEAVRGEEAFLSVELRLIGIL